MISNSLFFIFFQLHCLVFSSISLLRSQNFRMQGQLRDAKHLVLSWTAVSSHSSSESCHRLSGLSLSKNFAGVCSWDGKRGGELPGKIIFAGKKKKIMKPNETRWSGSAGIAALLWWVLALGCVPSGKLAFTSAGNAYLYYHTMYRCCTRIRPLAKRRRLMSGVQAGTRADWSEIEFKSKHSMYRTYIRGNPHLLHFINFILYLQALDFFFRRVYIVKRYLLTINITTNTYPIKNISIYKNIRIFV